MEQLNSKLDKMFSKMESMETVLHSLKLENTAFREELAAARSECKKKDEAIAQLTEQVNRLDQASRASTLRIIGLPVSSSTPASEIPKIVFKEILSPVIEAAKANGELPPTTIMYPNLLIESAFMIPAKRDKPVPVIVKLSSATTRTLIFRYKKTALPQIQDLANNRARSKFAIFEDLTPATHSQLNTFSSDHRVKSAWTFNGQIRFKIHDSETVYRARSLTDSYDSIVKPK
jgi:hypothetical protein